MCGYGPADLHICYLQGADWLGALNEAAPHAHEVEGKTWRRFLISSLWRTNQTRLKC